MYKVGDRVRVHFNQNIHSLSAHVWKQFGYQDAERGRIVAADICDCLEYLAELDNGGARWWLAESELELIPAIPDGWTPASEPPENRCDVNVLLTNGEKRLGWNFLSGKWCIYASSVVPGTTETARLSSDYRVATPGEVIAWREIEGETAPQPAPKPATRYVVMAELPTTVTVWHDTFEEADAEARRLCVKTGKLFRVLPVAAEYKPGEPVVTMFEE